MGRKGGLGGTISGAKGKILGSLGRDSDDRSRPWGSPSFRAGRWLRGIRPSCSLQQSAHHMFLSNCVVQAMRVWWLPAVLSPLAKHDTPRRGSASGCQWVRSGLRGVR